MFIGAIAIITIVAVVWFVMDQKRRGRFARLPSSKIDRVWFENNVLAVPAEVAGAAWDDSVGAGEVKAILWRWTVEQKIAVEMEPSFRLRLLAPRDTFFGYEAALVRALFVTGDAIEREPLIEYWKKRHELVPGARYDVDDLPEVLATKSFDVAEEIAEPLRDDAHRLLEGTYGLPREEPSRAIFSDLVEDAEPAPPMRVVNFMPWIYAGLLALAENSRRDPDNARYSLEPMMTIDTEVLLVIGMALQFLAIYMADRVRRKPSLRPHDVLLFTLPLLLFPVIALVRDASNGALFLFTLLYAGSMVNVVLRARSGMTPRHTRARQDLARARDFLAQAMQTTAVPASWIPYILAFDLGERLELPGAPGWNTAVGAFIKPFVTRESE